MRVVDAHAAENGKSLHKIFIVFGEREVIELVDQLDDADDLTRRVFDRHAQDRPVLEAGAVIDAAVEPRVVLGARYVHCLHNKHYSLSHNAELTGQMRHLLLNSYFSERYSQTLNYKHPDVKICKCTSGGQKTDRIQTGFNPC